MAPTAAGGLGMPPSSASGLSAAGSNAKAGVATGGPGGGGIGMAGGLAAAGGSNPGPEARWKHTATAIDDTRMLVFGGYKSSSQRCVRA
jgi:hypothetical protein